MSENISKKQMLGLMLIAYSFSFFIRMIWVWQFQDVESFFWNDQLMINTNDGYFFASGVQKELFGLHSANPTVYGIWDYGLIFFSTVFVKVTPFSLETVLLYMPAVVSSIVVVPIILIARLYGLTLWGFFAALLGSIAWSYYNRTMIGYYDTDMFSVMAPMFILYFLIKTIENENLNNVLLATLSILIYPFLYDAGLSIVYAMGIIYMVYMVVFHRKDEFTYQSIILISIALMGIPWFIKLAIIFGLYFIFKNRSFSTKELLITSVLIVIAFLITGNVFGLILGKIAVYTVTGTTNEGLHFFQVAQTVREAGKIPFETMANRIIGSQIGVIVAFVGYVLLVIKHRPFILALPLIGIGLFSLWGGLRFTIYAVPIAAMSSVFLFYTIANFSKKNIIKYSLIATLTIAMLYPNIVHIVGYKVPTVFNKAEVEILDKLKSISTPKDYTLTWWDYGYPIWYYSNTNTLIDGGKHNQDNFIISQILNSNSPRQSANLSRLAVETYVNSEYKIVANEIFKNKTPQQIDPNIMLDELRLDDYSLPAKTRDVFIYLPNRMLDIFPTVTLFSNLDLVSGKKGKRAFYYKSNRFQDSPDSINLGNNIKIIKAKRQIQIGMQSISINNFVTTVYDNNKILRKQVQKLNLNGNINVIFMKNYNQFLILDNKMYNSLFIQMFVLENYDKSLFEPVILEPLAKVYKLKI
ncbi:MAG: peptide-binding protein [Epsilonproteobacteria bacterium]|nr:MAG: peptide-binding protein [Campylobacterota bacterium]